MAVVDFGSRADLEARIGAARVIQLFDDDGDGLVESGDLANLTLVMGDASAIVTSLLLGKGWSMDQLELLKTDRLVIRAWSGIAAQLSGERKPEWLNPQGEGPFEAIGVRARADLKALARGETRSEKEDVAGVNPIVSSEGQRRPFIFAADPNDPNDRYGPGGF